MENHEENVNQKLVLDPFFTLVNNLKHPLHAINLKIKIFWKEVIKNVLKS